VCSAIGERNPALALKVSAPSHTICGSNMQHALADNRLRVPEHQHGSSINHKTGSINMQVQPQVIAVRPVTLHCV
jgi:hypothetical protein